MQSIQSESNFTSQPDARPLRQRGGSTSGLSHQMPWMLGPGLMPAQWSQGSYSDELATSLDATLSLNRPAEPRFERESTEPFIPRARLQASLQLPLAAGPSSEQEWLREHENEYRGQWVALDGSRLYAHGQSGTQVFLEAKSAGVRSPFLVFIEKDQLPSGGW